MNKKIKYLSWINYLLYGLTVTILGIIIIIGGINLYKWTITLIAYSFGILGIIDIIKLINKKKNKRSVVLRIITNVGLALIITYFPNIILGFFPICFSLYMLLNGIIKFISYLVQKKETSSKRYRELFSSLMFLVASFIFIVSPIKNLKYLILFLGLYIVLIGVNFFKSLIRELVPNKYKNRLKRSFRLSLPSFLDALIPIGVLTEINKYINNQSEEKLDFVQKKDNIIPDLEIFIHVAQKGFNTFGHVDIYFDNEVLSYGNYDKSTYELYTTIGEGVLFITSKEKYIPFCIEHSEKTLIGFGLKLTDKQKENVRKEIKKIKSNVSPWYPKCITDKKSGIKKTKKDYIDDYASLLVLRTNANLYKFNSGSYKYFFVLSNNCTAFADQIIGKTGSDVLKINGIITPGTYYDYLDYEFRRRNSIVVTKTIYNSKKQELDKQKKKKWIISSSNN